MELDDLKARWQKETEENINLNNQTMEQLEMILKKKTAGTLEEVKEKYRKIIQYLLMGLLLNAAISPFLHFLLGEDGPAFRITIGVLLSLATLLLAGLTVVFFYFIRYSRFNIQVYDQNLKEMLHGKMLHLKSSLRKEIMLIAAIYIGIFILGRAASQYLGNGNFADVFKTDIIVSFLLLSVIFLFYILARIRHYKSKLNILQSYLNELENGTV